jgi:two-component system sensor histidine kinase ChiS
VKEEQTLFISFDIIVQDYGYGMSQESVSKLFIDFNTIEENASHNRNGVGLGLSICKQLIE